MSGKAYACKVCGSKALYKGASCKPCHREYQTNNMRASRSAQKAIAARAAGTGKISVSAGRRICIAHGCLAKVASPGARHCATHAAAAMQTHREAIGPGAALRLVQISAAAISPTATITVLPPAAPSFRD